MSAGPVHERVADETITQLRTEIEELKAWQQNVIRNSNIKELDATDQWCTVPRWTVEPPEGE